MRVGGKRHARAAFLPGREGSWASGSVWKGEWKLAPNGIRSPDCPGRSELLYPLSYPGSEKYDLYHINLELDVYVLINIDNANYYVRGARIDCNLSVGTSLSTCCHRLLCINTDMCRWTTGILSEKCVFRQFVVVRTSYLYIHKPR
jgi:hypothetical protein